MDEPVRSVSQDEGDGFPDRRHPQVIEGHVTIHGEQPIDVKEVHQHEIEYMPAVYEGKVESFVLQAELGQHLVRRRPMKLHEVLQLGPVEIQQSQGSKLRFLQGIYRCVSAHAVVAKGLADEESGYAVGHSDFEGPPGSHLSNEIIEQCTCFERDGRSRRVRVALSILDAIGSEYLLDHFVHNDNSSVARLAM